MTEPNAAHHRVSRRSVLKSSAATALAAGALPTLAPAASAAPPPRSARLTWLSIANWLVEVGGTTLLIDGYISRLPEALFFGGNSGAARTRAPATPDAAAVRRVFDAIGGRRIDYVLTSHSHYDHSFDTATWARLTGASVIGSKTTAFQCIAQGIPASRCQVVNGGEVLDLGGGLTMQVIRTNHSGDASNPEQHLPVELPEVPTPDPVTGGLRAGLAEDFPNGGGSRAYLFTLDSGPSDRVSWLITSSLSAFDIDQPIVVDGVDFGTPAGNLAAALADAGLDGVDAWTGVGGTAVAERVLPLLRPRTYLPNHWDGLFNPFEAGLPFPHSDPPLESMVAAAGIRLLPQRQYMDAFRIDAAGVHPVPNHAVKRRLGFSGVQTFANARQAAAARSRAAADHGNCCG